MNERIYLASPHMSEQGYEQQYVKEAFETNWVAPLGPNVTNFEKELAEYVGVKSASALSSGTAAIHLGLKALGVTSGDVVFCSTLTFSASCNPILYLGATPVFIDSSATTWNMCPKALKLAFEVAEKNNKLPKAVVVVNLYGQSADMDSILELCQHYNVPILEDAAESLGATYKGKMSGTIGDIGIYSIEMMNICDFGESNYWLSVMILKETSKVKPLDIMLALEKENIESRPVWKPMHMQPIFSQYPFFTASEGIPVSEDYFNRGVCLPSDTKMTENQQEKIIALIKQLFN